MNSVLLALTMSLAALIPILFLRHPVAQAGLLWLAMQLAIQISFGFVPNALKVAIIACTVILVVQLVWLWSGRRRKQQEDFCGDNDEGEAAETVDSLIVKGGGCADINATDCWSDPDKKLDRKIEHVLRESAALSRELETYLRVDQP